jgi:hypothetical protein
MRSRQDDVIAHIHDPRRKPRHLETDGFKRGSEKEILFVTISTATIVNQFPL